MTHTLNRRGLSEDRPHDEIVMLCMAQQKQKAQKQEAMKEITRTILKHNPDNIMGAPLGADDETIVATSARAGIITAVFNSNEDVEQVVGELKSKKLGVSVVLSGLFRDVREVCRANDMKEHTYHISLGIFGKTDKLPDEKTLEVTTQCGHALISPHLVKDIVKKIKKGKMTSDEGASLLVKPCICGIGNPKKIAKILDKMAEGE
ncbi:MAG: hypothetical protein JRI34_09835 [Deltaproteobacteria bacterium]|nr:hypothetical protein [Deltaproteobacteria bacterium]